MPHLITKIKMPHVLVHPIQYGTHESPRPRSFFNSHFTAVINPSLLGNPRRGFWRGVLHLHPLVAGTDARYGDVKASSYHRLRLKPQSVGAYVVDINDIVFVVSVADDLIASVVVVAATDVAVAVDTVVALLSFLMLILLLML